jgi:hypothetical protein
VFPDAAARAAFTGYDAPLADDVGLWAYQQDNNTFWVLTDYDPITWVGVAGSSVGAGTIMPDDLGFDVATQAELDAHAAVIADATTNGHITVEQVQDIIGTMTTGATPIVVVYDDGLGHLNISFSAHYFTTVDDFNEAVRDLLGATLVAGTGVTIDVNDAGDVVTLSAASATLESLVTAYGQYRVPFISADSDVDVDNDFVWQDALRQLLIGYANSVSVGAEAGPGKVSILYDAQGSIATANEALDVSNEYTNPTQPTSQYAAWLQSIGVNDTNVALHLKAINGTKNYALIAEFGNVGIGSTNPTEKLEVAGNVKVIGGNILLDAGATVDGVDVSALGNTRKRTMGWYANGALAVGASFGPIFQLDTAYAVIKGVCNAKTPGVGGATLLRVYQTDNIETGSWTFIGGGSGQLSLPAATKHAEFDYASLVLPAGTWLRLDIDQVAPTPPQDVTFQLMLSVQ